MRSGSSDQSGLSTDAHSSNVEYADDAGTRGTRPRSARAGRWLRHGRGSARTTLRPACRAALAAGLAARCFVRIAFEAVPKCQRPRKKCPSTGTTRGSPRDVTVARSMTCMPGRSATQLGGGTRGDWSKIERRCSPAVAYDSSRTFWSARRSASVSCMRSAYGCQLTRPVSISGHDRRMLTWGQFAAARPDLAATGRSLYYQVGVGLGFLRRSGRRCATRRPGLPIARRRRVVPVPHPVTETCGPRRDRGAPLHSFPTDGDEDAFVVSGRVEPRDDAALRRRAPRHGCGSASSTPSRLVADEAAVRSAARTLPRDEDDGLRRLRPAAHRLARPLG